MDNMNLPAPGSHPACGPSGGHLVDLISSVSSHNLLFVFNTSIANMAADEVKQGRWGSIVDYHKNSHDTKRYLNLHGLQNYGGGALCQMPPLSSRLPMRPGLQGGPAPMGGGGAVHPPPPGSRMRHATPPSGMLNPDSHVVSPSPTSVLTGGGGPNLPSTTAPARNPHTLTLAGSGTPNTAPGTPVPGPPVVLSQDATASPKPAATDIVKTSNVAPNTPISSTTTTTHGSGAVPPPSSSCLSPAPASTGQLPFRAISSNSMMQQPSPFLKSPMTPHSPDVANVNLLNPRSHGGGPASVGCPTGGPTCQPAPINASPASVGLPTSKSLPSSTADGRPASVGVSCSSAFSTATESSGRNLIQSNFGGFTDSDDTPLQKIAMMTRMTDEFRPPPLKQIKKEGGQRLSGGEEQLFPDRDQKLSRIDDVHRMLSGGSQPKPMMDNMPPMSMPGGGGYPHNPADIAASRHQQQQQMMQMCHPNGVMAGMPGGHQLRPEMLYGQSPMGGGPPPDYGAQTDLERQRCAAEWEKMVMDHYGNGPMRPGLPPQQFIPRPGPGGGGYAQHPHPMLQNGPPGHPVMFGPPGGGPGPGLSHHQMMGMPPGHPGMVQLPPAPQAAPPGGPPAPATSTGGRKRTGSNRLPAGSRARGGMAGGNRPPPRPQQGGGPPMMEYAPPGAMAQHHPHGFIRGPPRGPPLGHHQQFVQTGPPGGPYFMCQVGPGDPSMPRGLPPRGYPVPAEYGGGPDMAAMPQGGKVPVSAGGCNPTGGPPNVQVMPANLDPGQGQGGGFPDDSFQFEGMPFGGMGMGQTTGDPSDFWSGPLDYFVPVQQEPTFMHCSMLGPGGGGPPNQSSGEIPASAQSNLLNAAHNNMMHGGKSQPQFAPKQLAAMVPPSNAGAIQRRPTPFNQYGGGEGELTPRGGMGTPSGIIGQCPTSNSGNVGGGFAPPTSSPPTITMMSQGQQQQMQQAPTVNNTYVNATLSIQQMNIQNVGSHHHGGGSNVHTGGPPTMNVQQATMQQEVPMANQQPHIVIHGMENIVGAAYQATNQAMPSGQDPGKGLPMHHMTPGGRMSSGQQQQPNFAGMGPSPGVAYRMPGPPTSYAPPSSSHTGGGPNPNNGSSYAASGVSSASHFVPEPLTNLESKMPSGTINYYPDCGPPGMMLPPGGGMMHQDQRGGFLGGTTANVLHMQQQQINFDQNQHHHTLMAQQQRSSAAYFVGGGSADLSSTSGPPLGSGHFAGQQQTTKTATGHATNATPDSAGCGGGELFVSQQTMKAATAGGTTFAGDGGGGFESTGVSSFESFQQQLYATIPQRRSSASATATSGGGGAPNATTS